MYCYNLTLIIDVYIIDTQKTVCFSKCNDIWNATRIQLNEKLDIFQHIPLSEINKCPSYLKLGTFFF